MKKDPINRGMPLERMLWKNELEFNRRELAIFESYLLNRGERIQSYQLTALMGQLYQYVQSVNKLLEEIGPKTGIMPFAPQAEQTLCENVEESNPHIREEIFFLSRATASSGTRSVPLRRAWKQLRVRYGIVT